MPSSNEPRPLVFYRADRPHRFQVGYPALCYPIRHPHHERVTGDGETPARTSPVQAVNHLTGEFWTANTHYAPLIP
jgi:hypothetical protein